MTSYINITASSKIYDESSMSPSKKFTGSQSPLKKFERGSESQFSLFKRGEKGSED